MREDLVKFEKILTLNDHSFEVLKECTLRLLFYMKETNDLNQASTEFLSLRLKDSEKNPFAKDLVIEWCAIGDGI